MSPLTERERELKRILDGVIIRGGLTQVYVVLDRADEGRFLGVFSTVNAARQYTNNSERYSILTCTLNEGLKE